MEKQGRKPQNTHLRGFLRAEIISGHWILGCGLGGICDVESTILKHEQVLSGGTAHAQATARQMVTLWMASEDIRHCLVESEPAGCL